MESFHFMEDTFLERIKKLKSNDNQASSVVASSKDAGTNLDTSCIARMASLKPFVFKTQQESKHRKAKSSIGRISSSSNSSTQLSISTENVSTLSSFDSICNSLTGNSDHSSSKKSSLVLKQSMSTTSLHDNSNVKRSSSSVRSSSGYCTRAETSKSDQDTHNSGRSFRMTRKLANSSNSFDRGVSLSNLEFCPPFDSTHVDNFHGVFKHQDEFLCYEPKITELTLSLGEERRLRMMKIVCSPEKTITVVLKVRSITPEDSDCFEVKLLQDQEIVPAKFNGFSSLCLQLIAKSRGSVAIELLFCSICGNYSSKAVIKVNVN